MKKLISLVLSLCLVLSLSACGGSGSNIAPPSSAGKAESPAEVASIGQASTKPEFPKEYSLEGGAAWEIDEPFFRYYMDGNYEYIYFAVPVKNTGSVDLFLKNMAYTFRYADGESETYQSLDVIPNIIQPGETVWYSADGRAPDERRIEGLNIKNITVEASKLTCHRYPVTELVLTNEAELTATGYVENDTDEQSPVFNLKIYMYDAGGRPLGDMVVTIPPMEPDEKYSFKATSFGFADDLPVSEIASYDVITGCNSMINGTE